MNVLGSKGSNSPPCWGNMREIDWRRLLWRTLPIFATTWLGGSILEFNASATALSGIFLVHKRTGREDGFGDFRMQVSESIVQSCSLASFYLLHQCAIQDRYMKNLCFRFSNHLQSNRTLCIWASWLSVPCWDSWWKIRGTKSGIQ